MRFTVSTPHIWLDDKELWCYEFDILFSETWIMSCRGYQNDSFKTAEGKAFVHAGQQLKELMYEAARTALEMEQQAFDSWLNRKPDAGEREHA